MWGRVRLAEREDGGGGGGHKDEEIGDGASEGGEGEVPGWDVEPSYPTSLHSSPGHHTPLRL